MSKHSKRLHEVTQTETPEIAAVEPEHDQIQALAYDLWLQRGCPIGSPEDDWYQAKQELKGRSEIAGAAA